ncbi:hypothetical protein [Aliivibrio fischeri]|uniref:hypothetical protein n=1 Tax=Aliivibrio fischeri TaxID=668 RepID=UPI0012DA38FD|nr:hypothetical protein [Aliivibrio fischeri]MUJ39649.1 hypothetical protein [Aliivibrio fischeri]
MYKFIIKTSNLIVLLISIGWLAKAPDWEPLIVAFGLLITFLAQDFTQHRKLLDLESCLNKSIELSKSDRELFDKFKVELASDGRSMDFLKEHDLGNSFHHDNLKEIDRFLINWDNAEHEFTDEELELQRTKLLALMREFREELSMNIQPKGNDFFSIGLNDFEQRPEMFELKNKLNQMATDVYDVHQELVRMCKKKLR